MLIMDGLALYSEPVVKWYHTHCVLATLMLCVDFARITMSRWNARDTSLPVLTLDGMSSYSD